MHIPGEHRCCADPSELQLADIFHEYGDHLSPLTAQQARVVKAITDCRTAALGGHIQECDHCGYEKTSYNSCRNRHCPKCQGLEQVRWLEAQQDRLLPTEYHHVVFTIPDVLHPLFFANPKQAYGLLFAAVAETLHEVALRPKNLGARIGFTAVLHSWTQVLLFHPHVHCIVTGGGLHPDGSRWVSAKRGFLFSVRILARVFRGKLLDKFEHASNSGTIEDRKGDRSLQLRKAARKDWVVYSKPPFAGPEQVLRYLGRYTHRVAISNERLVSMKGARVTFRWKDRAHGNKSKLMTLDAEEFLRRFLLHVVPKGLMRIRHYGLFANGVKHKLMPRCRQLLGDEPLERTDGDLIQDQETWQELLQRLTGQDPTLCPHCKEGHLIVKEKLPVPRFRSATQPSARSP